MDGLFEGLQIMTPQELESNIGNGSSNAEDSPVETTDSNDGFVITNPSLENPVEDNDKEEEEIVDSKTVKPVSTESNTLSSDGKEKVYKALMKEMVENGILTIEQQEMLDELPGTLDSIKSVLEETVSKKMEKKQEAWKNSLSKEKRRFLEIEDAFDSEDLAINMAQRLEFFDTIDEDLLSDNVDLQKQIYFESLKAKGFSDEEANEKVQDADDLGKLDKEAIKALPQLKKQATDVVNSARTEKIRKTEEQKEQYNLQFENLMKTIDTKESFIDGINLNKIAKDKLKDNIVKPIHTDESGKTYTSLMYKQKQNAAEFEMLINYYDSIGLFNMDKSGNFKPDISKLKAVAKTKAVNEIDKIIAADNERGVGRNTSLDASDKQKGIFDLLERAMGSKK